MYKPHRANYCHPIRIALAARQICITNLLSAVNSALGRMELVDVEQKTGNVRTWKKKSGASTTTLERGRWHADESNIAFEFDKWAMAVYGVYKIAAFESVELPPKFDTWLAKFVVEEKPAEQPTSPPAEQPAELVPAQ